jgi:hypothetical protein
MGKSERRFESENGGTTILTRFQPVFFCGEGRAEASWLVINPNYRHSTVLSLLVDPEFIVQTRLMPDAIAVPLWSSFETATGVNQALIPPPHDSYP